MKLLTELIGDNTLLALTLKEPYCSLMLHHGKIETRSWNTNYRGWVLLCAAKTTYAPGEVRRISGNQVSRINEAFGFDDQYKGAGICGYAFAVGFLAESRLMKKDDESACYVQYSPDLYCHIYKEVQAIEPFGWRGKQGFTKVPFNIIRQIKIL